MAKSNSLYKRLKTIIGSIIGFTGIYIVLKQISISAIYKNILEINVWLYSSSILVFIFAYFLMGERWRHILKEKEVKINLKGSTSQLFISNFLNMFIPFRAGDLYRGAIASDGNRNSYETGIMVLMERILDIVVLGFLLGLFVFLSLKQDFLILYAAAAVFLGLATISIVKAIQKIEEIPFSKINRVYSRFREALIQNFRTERKIYLTAITVSIWLFGAIRFFLVSESMNLGLGFWIIGVVAFSWAIIAALPLTPAGLGTVDASILFILLQVGVSNSDAATFILLNRAILQGLPLLIGGSLYLKRQI